MFGLFYEISVIIVRNVGDKQTRKQMVKTGRGGGGLIKDQTDPDSVWSRGKRQEEQSGGRKSSGGAAVMNNLHCGHLTPIVKRL